MPKIEPMTPTAIADKYVAVWSEPDPEARRNAIAGLWASDGVQFVEGAQFCGHTELETRITGAYQQFVESGGFTVASADDATGHHETVTLTIQLVSASGDVAWVARVFLILDQDHRIRRDYQFTVKPLTTE